jgi:hypothetical protein
MPLAPSTSAHFEHFKMCRSVLFFCMICKEKRRKRKAGEEVMIDQREEQVCLRLPLSASHIEQAVTAFREQLALEY